MRNVKNGQKYPNSPRVGDRCEFFLCLWPFHQCLKSPYAKFQKKNISRSRKMVKKLEKQTNIQTNKQTNFTD